MITASYCRVLAQYNLWQNTGLREALVALPHDLVTRDAGAFFGSLFGTANHLLWADHMWMSRFDGWPKPEKGIPASPGFTSDIEHWAAARQEADQAILAWAHRLSDPALGADLSWYSAAAGRDITRDITKPLGMCIAHFFNHQTHHRGQLHVLLTQAGWAPADTDLFLLPHQNEEEA